MSRQVEQKLEDRQALRRASLERALDYGIPGALEANGDELLGIAIRYEPTSCLMTIKAIVEGTRSVAFIGSDTMVNCVLKGEMDLRNHRMRWRPDKYHLT